MSFLLPDAVFFVFSVRQRLPVSSPVCSGTLLHYWHTHGSDETLVSAGHTGQSCWIVLQEKYQEKSRSFCSELLSVLLDSADWLFIFKPSGVYICILWELEWIFFFVMPQRSCDFVLLLRFVPPSQIQKEVFTSRSPRWCRMISLDWCPGAFTGWFSVFFLPTLTPLWPWSCVSVWTLSFDVFTMTACTSCRYLWHKISYEGVIMLLIL